MPRSYQTYNVLTTLGESVLLAGIAGYLAWCVHLA